MSFWLFVLVNGTLFIRPAEVVPALNGLPIYNVLIVSCLASCSSGVFKQLSSRALKETPITACVVGIFAMLLISNLVRLDFALVKETGMDFIKVVIYYLMFLATVDSYRKLQRFLIALACFTLILSLLALGQYHGVIDVPALQALERLEYNDDGEASVTMQLRSTGIYNDPNDLCLILVVGAIITFHQLCELKGFRRYLWLGPCGVFLYSLVLTKSRGGLLALLVSVFTLFVSRFGLKKAVPLAMLALPAMMLTGGRQTELSTGQGTAQERMEKWKQGLILFARSPLTGIGVYRYQDEVGLVAHNSYVHGFVEMGFPGGACFVGLFYFSIAGLRAACRRNPEGIPQTFLRWRPYLLAMVAGYATGIFSLSRNYIVPTYMIFGIVATYLRVTDDPGLGDGLILDQQQVQKLVVVSVCVLIAIKVFLAIAAH